MKLGPAPFLATHIQDDTAWVNMLYVPSELRHHGMGRHMFEAWLHLLPPSVHTVKLVAADVDGDCSVEFWEKMGFTFESLDPGMSDAHGAFMVRAAHDEAHAA